MYRATLSFTTKNYDVRKNQILADDFTIQAEIDEYLSIGYIVPYEETLEITQNGLYDVEGYIQADVDVPTSEPNLQNKQVNISSNGTTTIQKDTGYDGLNIVEVNTNVKIVLTDGTIFRQSTATNFDWLANVDFSNITTAKNMFVNCTNITTIPTLLNTYNIENTENMFSPCGNLISIPLLDTSKVKSMKNMFSGCNKLQNVPIFNTSNVDAVDGFSNMFRNCSSLSDESLNNILAMCINATLYTGTKTLVYIGISSTQATICEGLSNWNDFVSAGWSSGY